MGHISFAELREDLARYLAEVAETGSPLVVSGEGGKAGVVMISERDFAGLQETIHLLHSPANAERLLRSVRDADAGRTVERELIDPDTRKPA
jgi:antitoxin YefM